MSKFTRKNTFISSRKLVKSLKRLRRTERFAWNCFTKKLIWKISQKFTQKKLFWSPVFSYLKTCNSTKKEPHESYFPMTFEKIFQNSVLCQNTGKETEGTEVFAQIRFSKKPNWKISQNSSERNCGEVLFI